MQLPDAARQFAVEQWLYREAHLLDARRYDLWLGLLDPNIRYRVPTRSYVRQGDVKDFSTWSVDRELDAGFSLIDDDLAGLTVRIGRLQTNMGWAEMPPSMSRRLVGNVLIGEEEGDVLTVDSVLFLAKSRREERVLFTAERRDRLIRKDGGFRLLERYVVLDDAVLAAENLSLLF